MRGKKIVLALGGNAILQAKQNATYLNQLHNISQTTGHIRQLIKEGHKILITHGNGPQIGNMLRQNDEAASLVPPMPLDVLNAQTQGQLGYMLQQCLERDLTHNHITRQIICLLSRVCVDKDDPAFLTPSKPVGQFYDESCAEDLHKIKGWLFKPDAGRGWRRVIASPSPLDILEKELILQLLNQNVIVICCGGGGIPVIQTDAGYEGIEAVIDKDLSAALLGELVQADLLLIATDVPHVYLDYGTNKQKKIHCIRSQALAEFLAAGEFSNGSMAPKVKAAITFTQTNNHPAIICSLNDITEAIAECCGTRVIP